MSKSGGSVQPVWRPSQQNTPPAVNRNFPRNRRKTLFTAKGRSPGFGSLSLPPFPRNGRAVAKWAGSRRYSRGGGRIRRNKRLSNSLSPPDRPKARIGNLLPHHLITPHRGSQDIIALLAKHIRLTFRLVRFTSALLSVSLRFAYRKSKKAGSIAFSSSAANSSSVSSIAGT